MATLKHEAVPVHAAEDVVLVRRITREWSIAAGFSLVDQTKMVTAASELARNMIVHGGGGNVMFEALNSESRRGLRLTFEDQGPGIEDIELAMRDGQSSKGGLGLGLGGSKRLVNEFAISSRPGEGTRVCITRWK
jgi:serine/threonine-protein kinase RsbT